MQIEAYKKFTILIVDDDAALRNTIVFDFKRKGFDVLSAENGLSAMELIRAKQVHLVISDIRMPKGDGVKLLEEIRAYHSEIPVVILITGFADVSEEDCKKKGAKEVFSKPFDRKLLFKSVLESLGLPEQLKVV
jgi:CheY-like chemotaxis protein